ncbi:MAG: hypothetical protein ACTSQZ_08255 [Candidatus Thorarchaeota archaeon]
MTERFQELSQILEVVKQDPKNVPSETRKQFWKLVRQIKRSPTPNQEEIVAAAEIRDILFEAKRGRTYSIAPVVALETVLGFMTFLAYLWLLSFHLDWSNIFAWALLDWGNFALRFMCVMGCIAFFYPYGRIIGGRMMGIKLDGMCRDEQYEPTLKINYVSFLNAPASKRKWFFFIAGIWTIIIGVIVGVIGFFVAVDYSAFIPVFLIVMFEGYVILKGSPKPTGGEMGHYNREKKIERIWKKRASQI